MAPKLTGSGLVDCPLGGSAGYVTIGPSAKYDYVTDGTADDVQINAAFAAGHRHIRLAPGTFVTANKINLESYSNFSLIGSGAGLTIIDATGCTDDEAIDIYEPWEIEIRDFTLMRSTHSAGKIGINLDASYGKCHQVFNHLSIIGFDIGVQIGTTTDIRTQGFAHFQNCDFGEAGVSSPGDDYGVLINFCYPTIFSQCRFNQYDVAGIKGIYADSLCVERCQFIPISADAIGIFIDATGTNSNGGGTPVSNRAVDFQFEYNVFEAQKAGIVLKNNCFQGLMHGNRFYDCGNGIVLYAASGYTQWDIEMSHNRFQDIGLSYSPWSGSDYGSIRIYSLDTTTPSHDLAVIGGNVCVDLYGIRATGVNGHSINKLTVNGVTFRDRGSLSNPYDIVFDYVDRGTISGCTMQTTSYGTGYGIYISSASSENTITGNGGVCTISDSGTNTVKTGNNVA